MEGATITQAILLCIMAIGQPEPSLESESIDQKIQRQPVTSLAPRRRALAFTIPGFQRGQPIGSLDPWWYGYNFGDSAAGFYGGGNYTRYYAYSRGFPSIGDFPGPVPGRVWTNDPKRTPYLHQMPQFTQRGVYPEGPVLRGAEPSNGKVSGDEEFDSLELPNNTPANPKLIARVSIKVPAEAKITIEGIATKQKGASREFVSPELIEDIDYVYHLHAEWLDEKNSLVQRNARVVLRAGSHHKVLFENGSDKVLVENVK